MGSAPTFSVVIPAYNEQKLLPRLLDTVDAARSVYRRRPDAVEVIVTDNASTDSTAEVARSRGCRVVNVDRRIIGAARNAGAGAARGELLAFTDADMQMHPGTFNAVEDALCNGRYVAGATGVKLETRSVPNLDRRESGQFYAVHATLR